MSAPDPARANGIAPAPLLVVIDPVARLTDGESVRIARDVLRAGSPGVKVCLPEDPEETARALARRGSRRPVLVGNDRALLRAVQLLHREHELEEAALSVVPVGNGPSVALARGLGLPLDAVSAARTVFNGAEHRLDLLVDDCGGVVLGGLRIPAVPPLAAPPVSGNGDGSGYGYGYGYAYGGYEYGHDGEGSGPGPDVPDSLRGRVPGFEPGSPLRRVCHSLVRTVLPQSMRAAAGRGGGAVAGRGAAAEPLAGTPRSAPVPPSAQLLRVEADGKLLADLDEPVEEVSVRTTDDGGLAEVTVRPGAGPGAGAGPAAGPGADPAPVRAMARAVTVSGGEFRYRADTTRVGGPVRTRTWTVLPHAWRLVLPERG
ncbi:MULTISPECIES: hypothetical protein [unclassified Streptomyces]|uniref:hypothetical protein n=1 Tax=unclassified Streptomyces TaxID=2593676 RepID=UPI002DDBE51E|nr:MULTISPECIES: hypothetical protein [unclassified Streptomyces]WSA93466.1 hypothetical protein OIE63_19200 [Streptomyces sp. NBC_01795]WSB77835.1 hypothetical protein OHB04_20030 [Streptomyces sp. NBC_01775]WSS13917.1 hypothetical protein OG533_20020 [Streptomyces sp. NBC_01186]WSS42731.1 hypothetical protein OG220_20700 [Streptomyces sp. NBC_01187]